MLENARVFYDFYLDFGGSIATRSPNAGERVVFVPRFCFSSFRYPPWGYGVTFLRGEKSNQKRHLRGFNGDPFTNIGERVGVSASILFFYKGHLLCYFLLVEKVTKAPHKEGSAFLMYPSVQERLCASLKNLSDAPTLHQFRFSSFLHGCSGSFRLHKIPSLKFRGFFAD